VAVAVVVVAEVVVEEEVELVVEPVERVCYQS